MKPVHAKKPAKPSATFPLYAHAGGSWAKKIRGKVKYFGPWGDPGGALRRYHAEMAGLVIVQGDSVGFYVDQYTAEKEAACSTGDITPTTLAEYKSVCGAIVDLYGRDAAVSTLDYNRLRIALAKGRRGKGLGVLTLKRNLVVARAVFHDQPRAAKALKSPAARQLREARSARGEQLYTAAEIRRLIAAADDDFRWRIYLGINAAFSPKDCRLFPGPEGNWHNFPRVKTGVARRCHLWPETVTALKLRAPVSFTDKRTGSRKFAELCEAAKVRNIGFYSLKRTFVTHAEGSQSAINMICGWSPRSSDMASVYRQKTFDNKIRAVTDGLRNWLLKK
ncbi:hypothetical protein [Lacipirellula sp.]|uniref:hypothetical protein n=1 Tax=Lacipirellula sp. TaxID=2691419 RepID=UPI003D12B341